MDRKIKGYYLVFRPDPISPSHLIGKNVTLIPGS